MLTLIRPVKTLSGLFILCICCSMLAAQDSVNYSLIKSNAVPPSTRFSFDQPGISGLPAGSSKNNKQSSPAGNFQNFFFPRAERAQSNIACPDSSFFKIFEANNRAYNFYTSTKTRDGGIVIAGYGRDKLLGPPYNWYCVITKFDSIGGHLWSRELKSDVVPGLGLYAESIFEMADGSIIITGDHENPLSTSPPTVNTDFFIAKLTGTGNLTWFKTYHSLLGNGCTTSNIRYAWLTEGTGGELYIGATVPNCPSPRYLVVFKLNNSGDLVWQYNFTGHFTAAYCMGIFFDGAYLTVINRGEGTDSNPYAASIDLIKLNAASGAYISHKSWQPDLPYPQNFEASYLNWTPTVVRLNNGNYCVYGNTFGDFYNPLAENLPHFSVIEFNSNYDFVKGYTINSTLAGNAYVSKIRVDKLGKVIYEMGIDQTYPDYIKYYGIADNGSILHQRVKPITGLETFYDNTELFENGSVVYINNVATVGQSNFYLYYSLMHITDTSSECLGMVTDFSNTSPISYRPNSVTWTAPGTNVMIATPNQNTSLVSLNYTASPPCYLQAVCDTVKIHGTANSCDLQQDLVFTAYKNDLCGARVNWFLDTTVLQKFLVINDTTLLIRFKQPWQGWLYAGIQTSCGELMDSIQITIIPSPGPVNAGPDTTICPSNTVLLNAHKGYATYLWNNGSTDSLLLINTPGTYYVDVTDACGNNSSDTVHVLASTSIALSIGPDRMKCNLDTLHLEAPPGFLNYTWSPDYYINSTNTQQVVINPLRDTMYTLIAEKTPGCFAYDTVNISVNTSPPIDLGDHPDMCFGDSILLDAGTGFTDYLWNNGTAAQQTMVYSNGTYSVIGTTTEGCKSFDTVIVVNVYPLPVVSLNKDSTLCEGSLRILNAGNGFSKYIWNDGSTSQTINVSGTGIYSVIVTDEYGCTGSDTTIISKILAAPSGFLGADTAVCSYGELQLMPLNSYNEYSWSTGSTASSIIINQPGTYTLQVKDQQGCYGKDTVDVNPKDCLKGFYMPTGFTPNGDGKNDKLRPLLFGNVRQFEFIIYNRWGELIFKTSELAKGWDGTYKGQPQNGGVFVWMCIYAFDGEETKHASGTCVLIR